MKLSANVDTCAVSLPAPSSVNRGLKLLSVRKDGYIEVAIRRVKIDQNWLNERIITVTEKGTEYISARTELAAYDSRRRHDSHMAEVGTSGCRRNPPRSRAARRWSSSGVRVAGGLAVRVGECPSSSPWDAPGRRSARSQPPPSPRGGSLPARAPGGSPSAAHAWAGASLPRPRCRRRDRGPRWRAAGTVRAGHDERPPRRVLRRR